jgi:hypothetical protein
MFAVARRKLRDVTRYTSLIAVVGLGSSILSDNEDGLIAHVPVRQQKVLVILAALIALRELYLRIRDLSSRTNGPQPIDSPVWPLKAPASRASKTSSEVRSNEIRHHERGGFNDRNGGPIPAVCNRVRNGLSNARRYRPYPLCDQANRERAAATAP